MLLLMRWYKVVFSFLLFIMMCSLALIFVRGMNWGIDFTGGSVVEFINDEPVDLNYINQTMKENKYSNYSVQHYGNSDKQIRINLSKEQDVNTFKEFLQQIFPKAKIERIDFIGPTISYELMTDMIYAVLFAVFTMLLYIWIRFEWQFSLGAVLALAHDVVVSLGFISLFQLEFAVSSVAAILMIIGYSINDTVVLYDRIRENLRLYRNINLENLVINSVMDVWRRTVVTSFTTAVAVLILLLFGSQAFFDFVLIIFWGVIVGTLSSIFIAAPVILYLGINRQQAQHSVH